MSVLLAEGVVGSVGTFLSTHTGLVAAAVHGKKEEKGTNLKKRYFTAFKRYSVRCGEKGAR